MDGGSERLHATTICVAGRAVLIRGPSGSGKSDLALRCLTIGASAINATAARLVADDQTIVTRRGAVISVCAPDAIAGLLEVRGVGVLTLDYDLEAELALVVELADAASQPRLPDPWPTARLLGLDAPLLRLSPFEPSAAAKLLATLSLASLPPLRTAYG